MKQVNFSSRMFAFFTAVVISFLLPVAEIGRAEDTDSTPTLGFTNEKTTDFTVSKDIYNKDTDTAPMREMWNSYYTKENLADDEFTMTLYGGMNAQSMNFLADKTYIRRTSDGAEYMRYYDNSKGTPVEYILRPSADGYMLYDMSGNLQTYKETVTDTTYALGSEYRLSKLDTSTTPTRSAYRAMSMEEKFASDIAAFTTISPYSSFSASVSLTNKFSTDAEGNFQLRDSEYATFPGISHDTVKLLRVVEQKTALDALMTERTDSDNSYSGEYKYTADLIFGDETYSNSEATELKCQNYYDKSENVITITKKVGNYFEGTAITDVFADTQFKFEILTKDDENQYHAIDPDERIEYALYNKDGTEEIAQQLFKGENNDYRTFYLKSDQYVKFYYFTDEDDIYVREILAEGQTENAKTQLHQNFSAIGMPIESDTFLDGITNEANRIYQTYVQKQMNITNKKAENFTNVPNVFSFQKIVSGTDTGEDFVFRISKSDSNGKVSVVLSFVKREANGTDFIWTPAADAVTKTTTNGEFTLKAGETVLFTNPEPDTNYIIEEIACGANYERAATPVNYNTRKSADTSITASNFSSDLKTLTNTYKTLNGLMITKKVQNNNDSRISNDAEYSFKLQNYDSTTKVWTDISHALSYTVDGSPQTTTDGGIFQLKRNQTAYFAGLGTGTFRAVELNPNISNNTLNITDDATHIFMTEVTNGSDTNSYYTQKLEYNSSGYKAVNETGTENPSAKYWYEMNNGTYELSSDNTINATKTYYEQVSPDAVSPEIVLGLTGSPQITFTNTVWDKEYYFDIEKIAYLDKYIHGTDGDPTQKFVFKVERFAEGTTVTDNSVPEEIFYVDLTCDKQMELNSSSSKWELKYTELVNNVPKTKTEDYHYSMTPFNDASISYNNFAITRSYQKDGADKSYTYPCTIWNGRKTIIVKKTGIYRVSEDTRWSETDYDYCNFSSLYKGYGAENRTVIDANDDKNYVMFSVTEQKCDKFPLAKSTVSDAYRPTASFSNAESEYRYFTSGSYIDNMITR
ncbi:MAG: hypothetical protein IKP69_11845 [Oscillospiraceae bacterium]|nr:hypothetical protein [Oscillospiraceae bacterium]